MGKFHDTLGTLEGAEGVSLPDNFIEALTSAYDEDVSGFTTEIDSATGIITELQAANDAMGADNLKTKAHNYELLMAVGGPVDEVVSEPEADPDDAPDTTLNDLFED